MISQTPIYNALENRIKERTAALRVNGVKVELRKPLEVSDSIFKSCIIFETPQKIASYTIWEREILQVEVLVLDIVSGKSTIEHDGKTSNEKALILFDGLCESFLKR